MHRIRPSPSLFHSLRRCQMKRLSVTVNGFRRVAADESPLRQKETQLCCFGRIFSDHSSTMCSTHVHYNIVRHAARTIESVPMAVIRLIQPRLRHHGSNVLTQCAAHLDLNKCLTSLSGSVYLVKLFSRTPDQNLKGDTIGAIHNGPNACIAPNARELEVQTAQPKPWEVKRQ